MIYEQDQIKNYESYVKTFCCDKDWKIDKLLTKFLTSKVWKQKRSGRPREGQKQEVEDVIKKTNNELKKKQWIGRCGW